MRLVFVGASRFGLRCLEVAHALDACRVVGAVTAPRTFRISYRPEGVTNVLHADVESWCEARGLPVVRLADNMNEPGLFEAVEAWRPDAFLVSGWYHMVPRRWRDLAPAYGLHASLLPDYSGGAPLVWAMINGEERTGITLFRLGDGVDSGPIVGQAETGISPDDTIATLYARIEELGLALLERHLPRLAEGNARLREQDESRRRTFPQRGPEDGAIDWTWPARRVHDFVRAQTRPYPGAFGVYDGERVTIWRSRVRDDVAAEAAAPGCLHRVGEDVLVTCGDGRALQILEVSVDSGDSSPAGWWDRSAPEGEGGFCMTRTPDGSDAE